MADDDFNTRITASDETKSAFDSVVRNAKDFYQGIKEGITSEIELIKKQKEEAQKLAITVSGKNPDQVTGAFVSASGTVDNFGKGLTKALSVGAVTAFATHVTKEFASVQDAQNRLLATGKLTQEQVEKLRKEFELLGPSVGKNVKQLMADYENLLLTNDKLAANFPQMQQFVALTNASFDSTLAMLNTAVAGGLKPQDIPSYLDKLGTGYQGLSDNATKAVTMASIGLRDLGITGPLVQQQIGTAIAGLTPITTNSMVAAEGMVKVLEQVASGHGGANMQNMIGQLREGKISLIQFFDIMLDRSNPASHAFQQILENDPVTRKWVLDWREGRKSIEEYDTSTKKLAASEIFKPGTTEAINRLSGAISSFGRAAGEAAQAEKALNTIASGINSVTDAIERFNKFGFENPILRGMAGGPRGDSSLFPSWMGGGGGAGSGAPPGPGPSGSGPGGSAPSSSGGGGGGGTRGGGGSSMRPVYFSGGGGAPGPGMTYGQRGDALGLSSPPSTNIEDRRNQAPYTGPSGPGGGAQYFTGSGGSEATASVAAQRANDADVHQMASRQERTAAFTPGAGEGAWSPYAMIPPGGGDGGGGGGGGGWGPGTGHGGAGYGYGGGFRPGIGAPGNRVGGRGGRRSGPGGSGRSSGLSGPGGSLDTPPSSRTAPWPTGPGVSGGTMMKTPWGMTPTGQGPHTTAPATAAGGTVSGDARTSGGGAIYDKLLAGFQASGIVGKVPKDGARFGIKTGSAEEYAKFGTSVANEESGFNPKVDGPASDPGGSHGVFQYAHGQVPGGNAYNIDASVSAFVRDTKNATDGGQIKGSVLARRFATIGNHPERAIRSLDMAGKIAAGSGLRTIADAGTGAPGGARVGTLPWPGEGGAATAAASGGAIPEGSRLAPSGQAPSAFILHHTSDRHSPQQTVDIWRHERPGVGSQYIMDREGNIHDTRAEFGYGGTGHMLPDRPLARQLGLSNRNTVGMEITAKDNKDITDAQVAAAQRFIQERYPNTPVYGHGELQTNRERDEAMRAVSAVRAQRAAGTKVAGPSPRSDSGPAKKLEDTSAAPHMDVDTPWGKGGGGKDEGEKKSGTKEDTAGEENARRIRQEMSKPIKTKMEIGHPQGHTPERVDRHNTRIHQQSENRRQRHASYANIGHA
jgi:hypothetical protein